MDLLDRLKMGFRIGTAVLAGIGWALAAYLTVNPPTTNDALKQLDFILIIIFGIFTILVSIAAIIVDHIYDKRSYNTIIDAINAQNKPYAKDSKQELPAPLADPEIKSFTGHIGMENLVEADERAKELGDDSSAARAFKALPKPDSLKQQTFDLVNAVRDLLVQYHGSLDTDSFVSPEVRNAFVERLLAIKNKIRKFTGELQTYEWPVTVTRMARFLDRLEEAASKHLNENIPPVV